MTARTAWAVLSFAADDDIVGTTPPKHFGGDLAASEIRVIVARADIDLFDTITIVIVNINAQVTEKSLRSGGLSDLEGAEVLHPIRRNPDYDRTETMSSCH